MKIVQNILILSLNKSQKKIDNLIGGKLSEQKRIAGELKSTSNKRKLSKYSR